MRPVFIPADAAAKLANNALVFDGPWLGGL